MSLEKQYAELVCGLGRVDCGCRMLGCDRGGPFCYLEDGWFGPRVRARSDVEELVPNCAWIRFPGDRATGVGGIMRFNVVRMGVYVMLVYMTAMIAWPVIAQFIPNR